MYYNYSPWANDIGGSTRQFYPTIAYIDTFTVLNPDLTFYHSKYGEDEINTFDINNKDNFWPNKHKKNYTINIELPEFMCKCPRSGYPDFATIYIEYIPNEWVVELKAIKLYINSFMKRNVSHEDSANEIYDVLKNKLKL